MLQFGVTAAAFIHSLLRYTLKCKQALRGVVTCQF